MKNSVLVYLEETVKKYPDKTAIIDKDGEISFSQLREKALCLADAIISRTSTRHSPVFVYLPKGIMSIVSFMGILYSGNFYTPTDVRFPFEKPKSIIDCLNPELIITDKKSSNKLIDGGIPKGNMLVIEDVDFSGHTCNTDKLVLQIIDTDLVYTLFTSGSTGVPKGVSVTNRGIVDYIDWVVETYGVTQNDSICNQAPFYFDNSTLDIYTMICTGATLHIIDEISFAFPAKLMKYIACNEISIIFWVPSVLINVANTDILSKIDCRCLKKILFAGEVMPNKQLNYWRKNIPNAVYSNLYGPTEITVDCTYFIVNREFKDDEPLPIGYPCRNTDIMVLSEDNSLVNKSGQIGELCVRGSSLAAGYWGNAQKTSEVFIQNPLNTHYPELIYKTGDLVYYNERGELVFSGRKDFQIKHMGYRIELGEIEAAAMSIAGMENVCALYDDKKKQIVLFYTENAGLADSGINAELGKVLPKYMVPTKYQSLKTMPHNDNGKIDRKVLKAEYLER